MRKGGEMVGKERSKFQFEILLTKKNYLFFNLENIVDNKKSYWSIFDREFIFSD